MSSSSSIPDVDFDSGAPSNGSGKKRRVPDASICNHWAAQIKRAEKKGEKNREEAASAEKFYRGELDAWKNDEIWGADSPKTQENQFYRDANVLSGQLTYTDPRILVASARGRAFTDLAAATAAMANRAIREQQYRAEFRRAIVQAVFRNVAFVYHGWDAERQLPKAQWCANEVYPDPDCYGDLKRADWIAEETYLTLEDILSDPGVSKKVKKALLESKEALHFPKDSPNQQVPPRRDMAALIKVRCFKVWSKKGAAPHRRGATPDGDALDSERFEDGEDADEADADALDRDGLPIDPNPDVDVMSPEQEAAEDADRRLLLLIDNFKMVVKDEPWPIDCLDRDEFPYSMLRLTELPGDLYGVSLFTVLKPLYKINNFLLSFWFSDARASAQRINFYDESAIPEAGERQKLASGEHNIWVKTKQGMADRAVAQKEFTPRSDQVLHRLHGIVHQAHDDVSGVNDMARGNTGVEKTLGEAKILDDRAEQAINLLVDAVDDFLRDVARKTVMLLQRYVEAKTEYEECDECEGMGLVPGKDLGDMGMVAPMPVPCEACEGLGHTKQILRRGADFWLEPEKAKFWRDDLTLDEIRAELLVDVEPGSTRRSNQERKQRQLVELFALLGPIYERMLLVAPVAPATPPPADPTTDPAQLANATAPPSAPDGTTGSVPAPSGPVVDPARAYKEFVRRIGIGTELPDAEGLIPTDEEWAAGLGAMQAQAQAAQMQQAAAQQAPLAPDPEAEMQVQLQAEEQKHMLAQRAEAEKHARAQQAEAEKRAFEAQEKEKERQHQIAMVQADPKNAVVAEQVRATKLENDQKTGLLVTEAEKQQGMAATLASLQQTVQGVLGVLGQMAPVMQQMQASAAAAAQQSAQLAQMQASIAGLAEIMSRPKTISIQYDARGRVVGGVSQVSGVAA